MTDTQNMIRSRRLRPEARAHRYSQLFQAERKAVDAVVSLLKESADTIPPLGDRSHERRGRSGYVIDDVRSSRIAFLSGPRGSGKSSAMLTLMRQIDSRYPESTDIAPNVTELRPRVVLLDPLDMEPLAKGANLLAGILTRIEAAFEAAVHGGRGSDRARPSERLSNAVQELRALQLDVGISWDGNLVQRGSAVDLDGYSHDVLRAEHARLGLNARLANVLDELARVLTESHEYRNPIFLLPIDDFDLAPLRCLELLQLLRMVSVPRLFSVICGDIAVARTVVRMSFCGDMNQIAHERVGSTAPVVPSEQIAALGIQLTTNALRKLLPPGQRIELRPLEVDETLKLSNGDDPSLAQLLQKLDIVAPDETQRTLFSLLSNEHYEARRVLAMYPRHAVDFLHLAARGDSALDLVLSAAKLALEEDDAGDEAMTKTDQQHYQLNNGYFRVSAAMAPYREHLDRSREDGCALRVRDYRRWIGVSRGTRPSPGRRALDKPLAESEVLWVILYHDLCQLSRNGDVKRSLVPTKIPLVTAAWPDAEIPWRYPRWRTFEQMDAFIRRATLRENVRREQLSHVWLEVILEAPRPEIVSKLVELTGDRVATHLRDWLAILPVWLAPECGVDRSLGEQLLEQAPLADLWTRNARRIRRLRGDNLDRLDATQAHRLGARPQELWDLCDGAARFLGDVAGRRSIPTSIERAEDLVWIEAAIRRTKGRPDMVALPTVRARLQAIREAEVAAWEHPINAFKGGIFRPSPNDDLVNDYESSTFDRI